MPFSFEENKKDALVLLQAVAQELNTEDMNQAGRIFRAVLHSIRDRLNVEDAIHFAQQLPIIWKGIYFDHYELEKVPVTINSRQEWINYIRNKNAFAANNDFQLDEEISFAFKAVFNALQKKIPNNDLQRVRESLNKDIQELLEV
jgi:uncharacterized protein (DUF2267 family)